MNIYLQNMFPALGFRKNPNGILCGVGIHFTPYIHTALVAVFYDQYQFFLSENKYRNLFENAAEGIFRSDPTGSLVHVNPAMAHILGYPSPSHILEQQSVKSALETQEGYRQVFSIVVQKGECRQYQTELIRKEGNRIWVEVSAHASRDERGDMRFVDGLLLDVTEKRHLHDRLAHMAHTDELTGICNRRRFTEKLRLEIRRVRKARGALSFIMIDVDHFKAINDRFGHGVGDEALKKNTATCQKALRDRDVLGRLGGEEFGVILPDGEDEAPADIGRFEIVGAQVLDKNVPEGDPLFQGCCHPEPHRLLVPVYRHLIDIVG